jgi:SAM-dependent methyltransferase
MGKLLNIITPLHKKTSRNYLERMTNDKINCMKIAMQYGKEYWDGDRKYGYGGYRYDGRWAPAAKLLIEQYHLPKNARILDVGCGKGHLLYELKKQLPDSYISGFDISEYAIQNAKDEIKQDLFVARAQDPYPFGEKSFDLAISLNTLHNLKIDELNSALREIERVGINKYVTVESYRNEAELFNLECWALTCAQFNEPQEWTWLFSTFGYTGDYEFIYFE